MLESKIQSINSALTPEDLDTLVSLIDGYSGADISSLISEAAMNPVREIPTEQLLEIKDMKDIRGINIDDFKKAMKDIVPSVSKSTLDTFENWRKEKGQV